MIFMMGSGEFAMDRIDIFGVKLVLDLVFYNVIDEDKIN